MTIICKTIPNPWIALGLAAHYTARTSTFGRFRADELIRTLWLQISRGHYLLALDNHTDPARVVGYFGWAIYDHATAERFANDGVPPVEETPDGDVLWVLTAAAEDRRSFFALMKATRALYSDHRVMAVRHKGGRRVVLDQSRQRVREGRGVG